MSFIFNPIVPPPVWITKTLDLGSGSDVFSNDDGNVGHFCDPWSLDTFATDLSAIPQIYLVHWINEKTDILYLNTLLLSIVGRHSYL